MINACMIETVSQSKNHNGREAFETPVNLLKADKMKVLLAPVDTGGQIGLFSKALKEYGIDSISIAYHSNNLKYDLDIDLKLNKRGLLKYPIALKFFFDSFNKFDLYHFQFGKSLLPFNLDLPLLKILNKKIVFHLMGCDIRNSSIAKKYKYSTCLNCERYKKCKRRSVYIIRKFANKLFVTTPDLLEHLPDSVYLPVAIDLNKWAPPKVITNKVGHLIILHAPTNRDIKGTKFLEYAIQKLKKKGYDIELSLIENIPHNEVMQYYWNADIVVDQLLAGWYGLFAVEAMALGKPVISYIRNDLYKYQENLPIISANPDNIQDVLEKLIIDKDMREEKGKAGIEFVRKVHDYRIIGKSLIEEYMKI